VSVRCFPFAYRGLTAVIHLVVTIVTKIVSKHEGDPAAWRPINRVLVFALVPLWAAVLIFLAAHIWCL
jgi:hypothetical protein